jgi:hypothetical protein
MEKAVWTPSFSEKFDFAVYLDSGFAKEMIQSKVPFEKQKRMNRLAGEELKKLGIYWSDAYLFHKDSCFVSQFDIGQKGIWLATDCSTIERLLRSEESSGTIRYDSHNVDAIRDAYALMKLFDKWVDYSDILKSS